MGYREVGVLTNTILFPVVRGEGEKVKTEGRPSYHGTISPVHVQMP